tara:strand:+ start:94 stop:612 length:519 start_codon:yes stop_codon:yes gene_type:complete
MKNCFKCKQDKPLDEFYKHPKTSDGYLNKCKDCAKKDVQSRESILKQDSKWIEKERDRAREKYRRLYLGTGKSNRVSILNYFNKYPEKKAAGSACQYLEKEFEGAERHHWSYNEEHYKDVIWLTKKDHMKGHRFLIYDQERMMYRRFDTNELLDTKEIHLEFIKDCIKNKKD